MLTCVKANPVPAAAASQIAYQYGKDAVLILALDCNAEASHWTVYGKTPEMRAIAERLRDVLNELMELRAKGEM